MTQQDSLQRATWTQPAQESWSLKPSPLNTGSHHAGSWNQDDETRSTIERRKFASDKYLRGSYLGSGGWSTVYKVLRVSDGRVLAGKSSTTVQQLYQEARTLRRFSHDHILEFIDLHKEDSNPAATLLLTELCAEGMLQTRIDRACGCMDRAEILQVTLQISEALQYLHGRNVFHSDVKPRNILIRRLQPIDVVLADCVDMKEEGKCRGPPRGTQAYWSPEILKYNRHFGRSDDVWALGITLLGMIAQWPPLYHTKKDVRKYPRRCFDHVQALKGMNPDQDIIELLGKMMAWNVGERVSALDCGRIVKELLDKTDEGEGHCLMQKDKDLGIKAPEDFRPISFW